MFCTLYLIHLDPLSNVHDFDKRTFIGRDGVVDFFLISYP